MTLRWDESYSKWDLCEVKGKMVTREVAWQQRVSISVDSTPTAGQRDAVRLRALLFAIILMLGAASTTAAHAVEISLDPRRDTLEEQIAEILTHKVVALPSTEPRGEVQAEIVPLKAPTENSVISETHVFFEDCVMVIKVINVYPPGEDTGVRQTDKRIDLTLIETAPERVRITRPTTHPQLGPMRGSVTYRWQLGVHRRMELLATLAKEILDEAMVKFPADVVERLAWLAARYDEDLTDKIYLNAGERTHYVNGQELSQPMRSSPIFFIDEQAVAFVELMHRYQSNFCLVRQPI